MKKKLSAILGIGLCVLLAGCGSSYNKASYDNSYAVSQAVNGSYSDGFYETTWEESTLPTEAETSLKEDTPEVSDSSRKLIKNYDLTVETENFDSLIPAIEARVTALGGYIESLNSYNGETYSRNNRYSYMTVRIPKDKVDEFLDYVGSSSNVTHQSLSVTDVTLSYVDMQSRRDSYLVEQERLLDLLEKADNLEDILRIEERLSEVRYSLESMESQLRTMDNLVDYSTVVLSINEVKEYTEPEPETYGQRLSSSFKEGIVSFVRGAANFSVWFVGALPVLLLLALIVFLVVFFVKKIKARKQKKRDKIKAENTNGRVNEAPLMPSAENKEDGNKDAE